MGYTEGSKLAMSIARVIPDLRDEDTGFVCSLIPFRIAGHILRLLLLLLLLLLLASLIEHLLEELELRGCQTS